LQGILQNYWGCVNKNLPLLRILLLISGFLSPTFTFAQIKADSLDEIIARANELQLAKNFAWLNLLHFKSTLLGARESQVDDDEFFLAEQGAHDAQAELEASLHGFFSNKASAHPRCLFPHWLNEKLNLDDYLPAMHCAPFEEWRKDFDAQSVTLLFPGMDLDNPASMFGHTYIRFDRADHNHLLSYTLSYAAAYEESDSILTYSWNGITGGYPGEFFMPAFFETLKKYNEIEQRDIWEYPLNLNQHEIDQLIRHLWEMKGVDFDYFFFRENCSYQLLAMIDVAREDINMSIDAHPFYAEPIDTVRDIKKAGLITGEHYRPSAHNRIAQMSQQVGEEASQVAFSIVENSNEKNKRSIVKVIASFSKLQQAQILQLTDELLTQHENLSENEKALQLTILSLRSEVPVTQKEIEFKYTATPPEHAHKTARWHIALGEHETKNNNGLTESNVFYEFSFRPAFHDLIDVQTGVTKGAAINSLEAKFRWYKDKQILKFESLNFFSLQSIVPVKPWITSASKKVSFKIKQRDINESKRKTEFETYYAMGYATDIKSVLLYALARGQFEYSPELKNNHALYLGADTGLLWQFKNEVIAGQMELNYQWLPQLSGEEGDVQKLNLGMQFNVLKDHAVRFEYENINYKTFDVQELKFSYLVYF